MSKTIYNYCDNYFPTENEVVYDYNHKKIQNIILVPSSVNVFNIDDKHIGYS